MPVRSQGSLLAGTATFAGLLLAVCGCHSSPSDHDSFSMSNQASPANGTLLARGGTQEVIASTVPQTPVRYAPALPAAPPPGRVTLQPVPLVQTRRQNREVIASTFQPVQRVSAESPVAGPTLSGGVARTALMAPRSASAAPMPAGSPLPPANGPALEGSEPAVENLVLPQPRPLGPVASPAVVMEGNVPPPPSHPSVPREFEKMALPPYVVEPPDILLIQASNRITLMLQSITGQHLVGPDGTINLGIYGKIRVAGMTTDQIADAVANRLVELMPGLLRNMDDVVKKEKIANSADELLKDWRKDYSSIEMIKREMQVDVLAYNSKFYYVITDGGGWGQQVYPIPITGNETVLDAMAKINGLPAVANKKRIWVARATRAGQPPKILPVNWLGVAKCGESATNYQLFPGDRVYVDSNHLIKADSLLAKIYSPIQRTLGVTLLGASTVNSIKLGALGGSGLGGFGAFR